MRRKLRMMTILLQKDRADQGCLYFVTLKWIKSGNVCNYYMIFIKLSLVFEISVRFQNKHANYNSNSTYYRFRTVPSLEYALNTLQNHRNRKYSNSTTEYTIEELNTGSLFS